MFTGPGTRAGRGESLGYLSKKFDRVFGRTPGFVLKRGTATWGASANTGGITTTASFTVAAIGSTQSVTVTDATLLPLYSLVTIGDGTHCIQGWISSAGTTFTLQTYNIISGAAGNTMASGAQVISTGNLKSDWVKVVKTADESRSSTTTTTNDSELIIANLPVGVPVSIRAMIWGFITDTTSGWSYTGAFTGTESATRYSERANVAAGGTAYSTATSNAQPSANGTFSSGSTGIITAHLNIFLPTLTGAGTWSFQWAQHASSANATSVKAGSYFEFTFA